MSRQALGSDFAVLFEDGAIASLRYAADADDTEYIEPGSRLGNVTVRYRSGEGSWRELHTADPSAVRDARAGGSGYGMTVRARGAESPEVEVGYQVEKSALHWAVTVRNPTGGTLEIGDLALPLPIDQHLDRVPVPENERHPVAWGEGRFVSPPLLRHAFVSGNSSWVFWMRSDIVGPSLLMTVDEGTGLEYWDMQDGYEVFVHSAASAAVAREEHGTEWRQPNTSLTLEPGAERTYTLTLQWAADYDDIRRLLVEQGLVDVHVVPGMTVPNDLFVRLALRTRDGVRRIEAEFPDETEVRALGPKGNAQLWEVRFKRLGENLLTVHFGQDRRMVLEFFSTEPLETLIRKRASFLTDHQVRDPRVWWDGLLTEYAMDNHAVVTPGNYDRLEGWRRLVVTANDAGMGKPAYLASKVAEFPEQREVEAMDYYIDRFLWGGLQRTTEEDFSYGIYHTPDWETNRESDNPGRTGRQHLWRLSDYLPIMQVYMGMYRVARHHPQIHTAMTAEEYLERAYKTAIAHYTIPWEIEQWSGYYTGMKNGPVVQDILETLEAEGWYFQAERLRRHWIRKVRTVVLKLKQEHLYRTEYSFDAPGFEGYHLLAKYALRMAEPGPVPERTVRVGWIDYPPSKKVPLAEAQSFMERQIQANIFMRGWLETAFYLYGSDFRRDGGTRNTLSYMSQMGGWGVLDYALRYADDPAPYLRLGYASYLSSWALMNTGTAASNYGYWFPGPENDGAVSGGYLPAPFGTIWLEQPQPRGAWYYSGETDLGYVAGLLCARTVIADDPLFERFCYGGDWRSVRGGVAVTPKDGVRRRFHAMLEKGRLHLESEVDRFPADQEIVLAEDLSRIQFRLESDNPEPHAARLKLDGVSAGSYELRQEGQPTLRLAVADGWPTAFDVPVAGDRGSGTITLIRVA